MIKRTGILAAAAAVLLATAAMAQNAPGVTDASIKIGGLHPFSGPASAYGAIGTAIQAYVKMINDNGGVNGRTIEYVDLDDAYSPPKAVEQARKLVEQEGVAFVFNTLGTPTNSATRPYFNAKKVPHLFLSTGATKWGDYEHYPWTMGGQPAYSAESRIYAQWLKQEHPGATVAILYQNDDYGKDLLESFVEAYGEENVAAAEPYETSDPSVDPQVTKLSQSGADVFFNITTPKFAAQAIRKVHDLDWAPLHIVNNVSTSVGSVLQPAGIEASTGLISTFYYKDPTDPQWQQGPEYEAYKAWFEKYLPGQDISNAFYTYGYNFGFVLQHLLELAGDDLSREGILKAAQSFDNVAMPMGLPGVTMTTSPTDYYPFESMQLGRFNGEKWELFGDVIDVSAPAQ